MKTTQKSILIVDDEPSVREALLRALTVYNFEVSTAANGEEAVRKFSGGSSDLVLLDWNVSNENGWEIFQRLTRIDPLLTVIVITARPDQISLPMKTGADAVLEKPLDLPVLLSTIELLLSETKQDRVSRINRAFDGFAGKAPEIGIAHTEVVPERFTRSHLSFPQAEHPLSANVRGTNAAL